MSKADEVEVFVVASDTWVPGFELAAVNAAGEMWVRRQRDGEVQAGPISAEYIRPANWQR